MIKISEIKQASFRLNSETTEKFREYCETNHLTAAQGFDYLIEILSLENAKNNIITRQTEIENFEQHAKFLISAYLHSLELNENAESRIKEQFKTQLETQTVTISEYQEQIQSYKENQMVAKQEIETLSISLQNTQSLLETSESEKESLVFSLKELKENTKKQIEDKDSIISMLTAKLTEAEHRASNYDALKASAEQLQASLTLAEQTIKDNQKDAQISLERAVRETERTIEKENRKEINKFQSQITELLQTIALNEKNTNEFIRTLEKENSTLKEKLITLKNKTK